MDWREIKPLKEYESKNILQKYMASKGYEVELIDHKTIKDIKSPDMLVKNASGHVMFCEIKTLEHKLDEVTGEYKWDTAFNKIRKHIHKASKQLNDYNTEHTIPWSVIFVSNHPQLCWVNCVDAIQGTVVRGNQIITDQTEKSHIGDSNKDILNLDMIFWFQVNYMDRETIIEFKQFVNAGSRHLKLCEEIGDNLAKLY